MTDPRPLAEQYEKHAHGLRLAIDDVQQMLINAESMNYKESYICALMEVLIRLKAMLGRVERGKYPHPTSEVGPW